MSAYIRIIISKAIRQQLEAAQAALDHETARLKVETRVKASLEKETRERDQAAKAYALETLEAMNQKALERLLALDYQAEPCNLSAQGVMESQTAEIPQATKKPVSKEKTADLIKARLTNQILSRFESLKQLAPEAAAAKKELLESLGSASEERLNLIVDSLKLALANETSLAVRDQIFREELKDMLASLPEQAQTADLALKIQNTLKAPLIDEETVQEIRALAKTSSQTPPASAAKPSSETLTDQFLERALSLTQKLLAEQGYKVMGQSNFAPGQSLMLTTDHPDYRIQCRMDKEGGVDFQQLKVARDREEAARPLSDYELAQEKERSEVFCAAHERILQTLSQLYTLQSRILKRPGQDRLPVLIDPKAPKLEAKAKTQAQKERSKS
ncbi:MAG: hypothetical protein LBT38_03215 [Deltaproteobacteria bacterium]|jgi:hypothetical protein|nr:hypothetical protein [Deltaproteobacteria bacterium]